MISNRDNERWTEIRKQPEDGEAPPRHTGPVSPALRAHILAELEIVDYH